MTHKKPVPVSRHPDRALITSVIAPLFAAHGAKVEVWDLRGEDPPYRYFGCGACAFAERTPGKARERSHDHQSGICNQCCRVHRGGWAIRAIFDRPNFEYPTD
jgi:hypothetical protein